MSFPTPFARYEAEVLPAWIDANNHMNMAYYVVIFDLATDEMWDDLGIGIAYKHATSNGTFAARGHIAYENEMLLGERGRVSSRIIGVDSKRLHTAHELFRLHDGKRAATFELLSLHVDLVSRRVAPWPDHILAGLTAAAAAHAALPLPDWVGRPIAIPGTKA
ncbi:MAG: thioesterase family protein [Alphaproteobacteria bacterium]|nr:thioesterase family protein [Alphaproteobacteria bacterium]